MHKPIKKVVVVGRDADAWITALFLKSGLDKLNTNLEIQVIELPSNLTKHDFYSVLPSYKTLHETLGANEDALLSNAQAHHFFGQKFSAWNKEDDDFIHSYERLGINFNSIDFYQYWLKAKKLGLKVALEDFNMGAVAAKQHLPLSTSSAKSDQFPNYGYHISSEPYVLSIANAAIALGVKHIQSDIKKINKEDDTITSLILSNDKVITADLFIDASGSKASLISQINDDNFESWSQYFLCDRMITTSISAFNPCPTFSLSAAFSCGWYGLYPLKNRTGVHIYYSSKHSTKEKVLKEVSSLSGQVITADSERKIECGLSKQPWIGNCIAVGNALATLESIDALQLQPLLTSLVQLRELFPVNSQCSLEAKQYNKNTHAYLKPIRDFQLSHYLLSSRDNDSFWKACQQIQPPSELKEKIELFKSIGHVSLREYDTFQEENWTLLFNGHGLQPEQYNPLVDQLTEQDLMNQFIQLLKKIAIDTKALS